MQAGTDQTVTFSESASVELTDEVKMVYKIDDDTLYIRFRRKSINTKISYGKKLQMTVPAALVEDLTLNLVSTDAQVRGLRLEDLEVNVTDGDMDFPSPPSRTNQTSCCCSSRCRRALWKRSLHRH